MANRSPSFQVTPQVVVGLLAVVFGLALTADNVGLIRVDRLWSYWPVLVIGFGAAKFAQATTRSGHLFGLAVMLVGAALGAESVWGVEIDLWNYFPLVFVALGIVIVMRAWGRPPGAGPARAAGADLVERPFGAPASPPVEPAPGVSTTIDNTISEFAFWSGSNRRVASPHFRRADLTAIMGGVELDLRPASTATGEAVIDVFVWWGGIEITVPPDWAVSNQVFALMGAAEDHSSGTQEARHRLVVRGFVVMGGVEIKTK